MWPSLLGCRKSDGRRTRGNVPLGPCRYHPQLEEFEERVPLGDLIGWLLPWSWWGAGLLPEPGLVASENVFPGGFPAKLWRARSGNLFGQQTAQPGAVLPVSGVPLSSQGGGADVQGGNSASPSSEPVAVPAPEAASTSPIERSDFSSPAPFHLPFADTARVESSYHGGGRTDAAPGASQQATHGGLDLMQPLGVTAEAARLPTPALASTEAQPAASYAAGRLPGPNPASLRQSYGRLPLSFEANYGQTDAQVHFLSRGSGSTLFLTSTEAVMVVSQAPAAQAAEGESVRSPGPAHVFGARGDQLGTAAVVSQAAVLRMQVVGGNPSPQVAGLEPLPGKVNYFLGNDPTRWHRNVPTYAKVQYQDIYAGINLFYYGNQGQLEYDFVAAPGADPNVITLGFMGADQVGINGQGDLVLHANGMQISQHKPIVYQEVNGVRQVVPGVYVPKGQEEFGFQVAAYDRSRPLVIDPVLSYSTYLGGKNTDVGNAIAVDSAGNAYVTGFTTSTDFPHSLRPFGGQSDAFVTKVNATGSALLYSTYLGGSGQDQGNGIAVDSAGSAYVVGQTTSPNFPTANPLQKDFGGGLSNAFVTKLNATGSKLIYSSYMGGSGLDVGAAIALDQDNNAYVTGSTTSTDFPTANALYTYGGGGDAFVAKIGFDSSTETMSLGYSTYLGGRPDPMFGAGVDQGKGIAVDSEGNAYVTGFTNSTDFPTRDAFQGALAGGEDAFVTKLNTRGSDLLYSTYLGGHAQDYGSGIAVDGAGNAYVTGWTGFGSALDFPTKNAFQPKFGGGPSDAFVAKVDTTKSGAGSLVYLSFLGGSNDDMGAGIAIDGDGNAYVTGGTQSTDFPTVRAIQSALGGQPFSDAFVTKVNAAGSALVYSTYLGGSSQDGGTSIAADPCGNNAYVTGTTQSTDFPLAGPLQKFGGVADAFIAKIGVGLTVTGIPVRPTSGVQFTGHVATFTSADPNATPDRFTAKIAWGDGSTSDGNIDQPGGAGTAFFVTGTHTYGKAVPYPILVTVHDSVESIDATADVNISRMPLNQYEGTIAIDPTNPSNLFAASNTEGNGLFAAYSIDAGATWATRILGDGLPDGDGLPAAFSDPKAVFDAFGNLFLVYITGDITTQGGTSTGGNTATTLNDTAQSWRPNQWAGSTVMITSGTGAGQRRRVASNTATQLTVTSAWFTTPDNTSTYALNALNVVVVLSTNGGQTFSFLATLGSGGSLYQPNLDQPSIATGPSGTSDPGSIWVTWQESGAIVARGAAVTGLGVVGAFNATQVAPGSDGGNFGDIKIGPSGQVLVTYQISVPLDTGTSTGGNFITTLNDASKSWAPGQWVDVTRPFTVRITGGTGAGQVGLIAANTTTQLTVTTGTAWNSIPDNTSTYVIERPAGPATIYVNLDADGLGSGVFGARQAVTVTNVGGFRRIPAQNLHAIDAEANLAWDRSGGAHNGRVYVAFTDARSVATDDTDIFLLASDDNGTHWTALGTNNLVQVNDDPGTNSQFLPSIAMDQITGNIVVAWYDARNDTANTKTQFFAAVSSDGGLTFSPNVTVSVGTSDATAPGLNRSGQLNQYLDYTSVDFFNGILYPVWADNSRELQCNPDLPQFDLAIARVAIADVGLI